MEQVIKKLKFKSEAVVINAPSEFVNGFSEFGFANHFSSNSKSKETLVFVNNNAEFLGFLKNDLHCIAHDSIFWMAYPKISSGIKTDINRDIMRESVENFGLQTVTAISIDDTWSALRFRPIDKVGK